MADLSNDLKYRLAHVDNYGGTNILEELIFHYKTNSKLSVTFTINLKHFYIIQSNNRKAFLVTVLGTECNYSGTYSKT